MSLKLYTAEEVAELLGLKPSTVKTLAKNGKLIGMRQGIEWRFRESNIAKYIDDLEKNPVKLEFNPKKATDAEAAPVANVETEIPKVATEPKVRKSSDAPRTAKVITEECRSRIDALMAEGKTQPQICQALNDEGHKSATGLEWNIDIMKRYVRNHLKGKEVNADEVPL